MRLNRDPSSKAARAVMRERASKRLILNARLYASMPTSRMAPPQKGITFAVVNTAPAHAASDAAATGASTGEGQEGSGDGGGEGSSGAAGAALATYALRLKTADAVDTLLALIDAWKVEAAAALPGDGGEDGVQPDAAGAV